MIVASDGELLGSYVENRDAKSFEILVSRHGPRVWRVCRQVLGHTQDAEDAFQSTFLLLAGKADSIRKGDSLGHWLHGAAHRIAVRSRLNATRRRVRENRVRPTPDRSTGPDVDADEVHRALHEEIDRLPTRLREPIRLCYLDGMTNIEAARLLGCPPSTLKERLASGRDRLRRGLDRRGLTTVPMLLLLRLPDRTRRETPPAPLVRATINAARQHREPLWQGPIPGLRGSPPRLGVIASTATTLLALGASLILLLPTPPRGTWLAWLIEAARKACH